LSVGHRKIVLYVFFFTCTHCNRMTVEHLSHASADRDADRMMNDVKVTSRIRFPPRPPPTFSARESLELTADELKTNDNVLSARVVNEPPVHAATAVATTPKSVEERVRDFYADFEALEPILCTYLSNTERKRFARAVNGPSLLQRPEMITTVVSIVVLLMTVMVCLHPSTGERRSRGVHAPMENPMQGRTDSSSTANFNIRRILEPLNRNR
jgi:hypothetical protein